MDKRVADRIRLVLVLLWIVPSVLVFFGVSIAMVRDPEWSFGIGLIETTGIEGLWATVPMGSLGAAAVALLFFRRRLGAKLLVAYSLIWTVSLLGGLLRDWYQAGFQSPPGTSPGDWRTEVLVIGGMALFFVLVIFWAWNQSCRRQASPPEAGRPG